MGKAYPVTDADEKAAILKAVTEHLLPGRTAEVSHDRSQMWSSTCSDPRMKPKQQGMLCADICLQLVATDCDVQVRGNSKTELSATAVLALDLVEVSAKVRTGMPKDEERDYSLPDVWAGILPFAPLKTLAPIDDDQLIEGIKPPPSVTDYKRPVSKP